MTDFRFDSLMNVKTPDSWVEKAVRIPQTRRKPPLSPRGMTLIAAAAALAVITGVSVFLFLTTGEQPLPVSPQTTASVTVPTFTTSEGGVAVTTPQGATQPVTDGGGETLVNTTDPDGSSLTASPTNGRGTRPAVSGATEPTEKPSTAAATEPPTQGVTEPPEPTDDPAEASCTEEPWVPEQPETVMPETEDPNLDPPDIGGETDYFKGTITYVDDGTFPANFRYLQCHLTGENVDRSFMIRKTVDNTFTVSLFESAHVPVGAYTVRVYDIHGTAKTFSNVRLNDGGVILK